MFCPNSSAASASAFKGRVAQRTATRDSPTTAASNTARLSRSRYGQLAVSWDWRESKVTRVPSCRRTCEIKENVGCAAICIIGPNGDPCSALGDTHRTAHLSWGRRHIVNYGRLDQPFISEKPTQHRGEKRRARARLTKLVGSRHRASVQTYGQRRRAQDTDDLTALRRARRFQQPDDIRDALSRLHAARLQQQLGALVHVNREAHELRDEEPAKQH